MYETTLTTNQLPQIVTSILENIEQTPHLAPIYIFELNFLTHYLSIFGTIHQKLENDTTYTYYSPQHTPLLTIYLA